MALKGGRGGTAVVREGSGCRPALRKFKYNQLLHQALEQKIIEKSQRDGLTVYRPAPLLKSRPPSYICPLIGDLDMRGRLPEPPRSE